MSNERAPIRSVVQQKTSAVDLVLHEIRRSILSGALAPGEPLVVQTLTDQLGVSHVPVREALRQLEAQGLLTLSHSRSAMVNPLDPVDLHAIYRLRLWIEPELAAQSATQRSAADLNRIEQVMEQTFHEPTTESQWDLHRQFHQLLITPAASAWDLRVLNGLWDAAERFTRLTFDPSVTPHDDLSHGHKRHRHLFETVCGRDPERIRVAVRDHLQENEQTSADRLQAIPAAPNANHRLRPLGSAAAD